MKRRRLLRPLLLIMLVVALFIFAVFFVDREFLPNPRYVIELQTDLADLLSITAFVIAIILVVILVAYLWIERRVERERQTEQALQTEARRRFLQRLDHELKNPLTIMGVGIANLQQSPDLDEEQQASLVRLEQQKARLQKLVQDLRWLSELEALELDRSPVELGEVLNEAKLLACGSVEARERSVELNLQQVPWPIGRVSGDTDLLVLAFRNILDNALKFTKEDDRIEVRALDDGQVAVVEVADAGTGISPVDISHVFEELYRGPNATGVPGSGLGLTLVERIVTLHEGEVIFRSREGQGTVVIVRLPLAPN